MPSRLARLAVWTSWSEQVEAGIVAWPFTQIPGFLTQQVGVSTVIVLDAHTMIEKGTDVSNWLAHAEPAELRSFPVFDLREGTSVWLPLGSMPVIIGPSPKVRWGEKKPD